MLIKMRKLLLIFSILLFTGCSNIQNAGEEKVSEVDNSMEPATYSLNIVDDVKLEIISYDIVDKDKLDQNERSNLKEYIKENDDKVFRIEYRIVDSRDEKTSISTQASDGSENYVRVKLIDNNDNEVTNVSQYSTWDDEEGIIYNKDYFIIKDKNNLKGIDISYNIDGQEGHDFGIEF